MPAVAKKKKAKAVKKGAAEAALKRYEEQVEERYQYALEIKKAQDDQTDVAINRMVMRMQAMAGPPLFYFNGEAIKAEEERLKSIQYKSLLWCAVRLFVACAEWEIRIANFTPIKKRCARCGKKAK